MDRVPPPRSEETTRKPAQPRHAHLRITLGLEALRDELDLVAQANRVIGPGRSNDIEPAQDLPEGFQFQGSWRRDAGSRG